MRLNRLTGLEQDKIIGEFQELLEQIRDLSDILARPERLLQVIRRSWNTSATPSATSAAPKSSSIMKISLPKISFLPRMSW